MNGPLANRVVFLDGLRALATIAVLLQHYLENVAHEAFLPFLRLAPGLFGVALFFCISGYVIPFSVKHGLQPIPFLLRRVGRIFPLYLCVITGILLLAQIGVAPFAQRLAGADVFDILANFMLVYEYVGARPFLGVSWTLSVEFAWYLMFAVYFMTFGHRHIGRACVVFSIAMIALAILSMLTDTRLPLGRVGMLGAALLGYTFCCWHLNLISRQHLFGGCIAFSIATLVCQWVSFGYFIHPHMSLLNGLAAWTIAIATFILIAGAKPLREAAFWAHPVITGLGRISYGIYLLHMPVFLVLQNTLSGAALVACSVLGTLVCAEIAHRWIEVPGNALGKQWGRPLRPA